MNFKDKVEAILVEQDRTITKLDIKTGKYSVRPEVLDQLTQAHQEAVKEIIESIRDEYEMCAIQGKHKPECFRKSLRKRAGLE